MRFVQEHCVLIHQVCEFVSPLELIVVNESCSGLWGSVGWELQSICTEPPMAFQTDSISA